MLRKINFLNTLSKQPCISKGQEAKLPCISKIVKVVDFRFLSALYIERQITLAKQNIYVYLQYKCKIT